MSAFKVEVVRVSVEPHPNADRLDILRVKGWQCVGQKGQFKNGDMAVYLPVDSVLPESLVKSLGIEKNYHGRLRTIKLRGAVSQGMVMPIPSGSLTSPHTPIQVNVEWQEGDDLASFLGVTKYDPPIPVHMGGECLPEESRFAKYTDIENLKNHPDVLIPGETLWVSEKIHGTNFRAMKLEGRLLVGSHTRNLKESEENLYWRAARMLRLADTLDEGMEVFGEVFGSGIQDLTYGCKPGEIRVGLFDAMVDNKYLDYSAFMHECCVRKWPMVPILGTKTYDARYGFSDYSDCKNSTIETSQMMEGVVLRPTAERWNPMVGRVILKSISDEYLLRRDGTERH